MPKKGYKQTEAHKKKSSESKTGKNNPMYGKFGEKHPSYGKHWSEESKDKIKGKNNPKWKGNNVKNISVGQIHRRIEKIKHKPIDKKCKICHEIADKKGITKLILSNIKKHQYTLNPEEYQYIHESCHKRYDLLETKEKMKKAWTPEKKKEFSELMKQIGNKYWTPERRKEQADRVRGENNPMRRPEVVEKWKKTMKETMKKTEVIQNYKKSAIERWERPNVKEKFKKSRWTPERRKEQSIKMRGENSPMRRPEVVAKKLKSTPKKYNKSKKTKAIKSSGQINYWLKV